MCSSAFHKASSSLAEEQEGARGSDKGVPEGTHPAFLPPRVLCHYHFSKWMKEACRLLGLLMLFSLTACIYLGSWGNTDPSH